MDESTTITIWVALVFFAAFGHTITGSVCSLIVMPLAGLTLSTLNHATRLPSVTLQVRFFPADWLALASHFFTRHFIQNIVTLYFSPHPPLMFGGC